MSPWHWGHGVAMGYHGISVTGNAMTGHLMAKPRQAMIHGRVMAGHGEVHGAWRAAKVHGHAMAGHGVAMGYHDIAMTAHGIDMTAHGNVMALPRQAMSQDRSWGSLDTL